MADSKGLVMDKFFELGSFVRGNNLYEIILHDLLFC